MTSIYLCTGVLLLSWLLLGRHYNRQHLLGAIGCVVGLAVLVITDSQWAASSREAAYPHAAWGDALTLLGAAMYSACNVAEEALLGVCLSCITSPPAIPSTRPA